MRPASEIAAEIFRWWYGRSAETNKQAIAEAITAARREGAVECREKSKQVLVEIANLIRERMKSQKNEFVVAVITPVAEMLEAYAEGYERIIPLPGDEKGRTMPDDANDTAWSCERCHASGVIRNVANESVYDVIAMIEKAHDKSYLSAFFHCKFDQYKVRAHNPNQEPADAG